MNKSEYVVLATLCLIAVKLHPGSNFASQHLVVSQLVEMLAGNSAVNRWCAMTYVLIGICASKNSGIEYGFYWNEELLVLQANADSSSRSAVSG